MKFITDELPKKWQHPDIVFCIERSSDDEWVIVYRVRRKNGTKEVDWDDPMDVFWLDLSKGDALEAREELSKMELWAGYGVKIVKTSTATNSFKFHLKGFPGRNIEVQCKENESAALVTLLDKRCILKSLFLKLKTGFFKNPAKPVEYANLVGRAKDGLYVTEAIRA